MCEQEYIWNTAVFSCENGKYLASIIDYSAITCDEIMKTEETKAIPKNIIYVSLFYLPFYWLLSIIDNC